MTGRTRIAAVLTLVLVPAWVAAALRLSDLLLAWPFWARSAFYVAAGFAWVFPVWGLMLWSVRAPRPERPR
jgi:hypothetical protein